MKNKIEYDRIAIFEELNRNTWSNANSLLRKGYVVFHCKIDKSVALSNALKKGIENGTVQAIDDLEFEFRDIFVLSMIFAHKHLDNFFEEFYYSHALIKKFQALLKHSSIINMYKKHILKSLQDTYLQHLMVNEIARRFKSKKTLFCFLSKKNIHIGMFSLLDKQIVCLDKSNMILEKFKRASLNLRRILVPLYYLLKKFGFISISNKKQFFQVGISINHHQNIFSMNYFTESIIVDKEELPKEKILFIEESPGCVNVLDYQKRGYNFDLFLNGRKRYSIKLLTLIFFKFLPVFFRSFIYIFDEKVLCCVNSMILKDYILWHIFFDNYHIKHYVRWGAPENVSRFCLLHKALIKTWFVYPDNTTCDQASGHEEKIKVDAFFAFMHYDYAVVYGNKNMRAFQQHRNSIGKYIVNGNLFAQIDRELKEGKCKSSLEDILTDRGIGKDNTIIGFFDSGYGNLLSYKFSDAEGLANDLCDLLDENPEMVLLFKTKKEFAITPQVEYAYQKLRQHDRCLFFERYSNLGISAPEIITMSDLVITVLPSSPTMEAIVSHKKAFYYDINGSLQGDNFYFNRIPNLVAHGKKELNELVRYWLHDVDSEKMRVFQEAYIKNEMDPYLDGKALSRLRNLLMDRSDIKNLYES